MYVRRGKSVLGSRCTNSSVCVGLWLRAVAARVPGVERNKTSLSIMKMEDFSFICVRKLV